MPYSLADFDYVLPTDLIAQQPLTKRSASKLLAVDTKAKTFSDKRFNQIVDLIDSKDLVIFNDTKVFPARFNGAKSTGGKIEGLIERIVDAKTAWAHIKSSKSPKLYAMLQLIPDLSVEVVDRQDDLFCLSIEKSSDQTWLPWLNCYGSLPLPPYITRQPESPDYERYQTVYAHQVGAVAAPTAGLHFDQSILQRLVEKGVAMEHITLHVGAGTFQPVRVDSLEEHVMHKEWISVSQAVCDAISSCQRRGGRVIAVGTTVLRALESTYCSGALKSYSGDTDLFITPGFKFNIVDALLTNFHLPKSTLLMLVSAFGGYELTQKIYQRAVSAQYRFFSYGDCMFLERAQI